MTSRADSKKKKFNLSRFMIGLPRILTGSRAQLGQKQFDLKKKKNQIV